jgi:adenylyl-sulfate kinase
MSSSGRVVFIELTSTSADDLTVRGDRLIAEADVVLHDAAVPGVVFGRAGKQALKMAATDATATAAATIEHVRAGRSVIRLVSNTPKAIAQGAAEFELVRAAGVSVETIAGVVPVTNAAPQAPARFRAHRPAVIFLTGLSGSGKSTLATGLESRLRHAGVHATIVDGDVLRTGLSNNLGFTEADRHENIRRATELALHLANVGLVVVVALISPFEADRATAAARAKAKGIPFAEVFVNAPLAVCERRDPKNLYKRARAGQIPNFTGIDSPYQAPSSPQLELRTDLESVDESLAKLSALAFELVIPTGASGALA